MMRLTRRMVGRGIPGFHAATSLVSSMASPTSAPPLPTLDDDNGVPGDRGLERNLDMGVTFTSSVAEVERENPLTKLKEKVVERTSRGVFDVRLSPWLYLGRKKEFDRNQKWYHYFDPFFLDAAVSTGKIDTDTLSMNRVIFGAEYEWRYYAFKKDPLTNNTRTSSYVDAHRFILVPDVALSFHRGRRGRVRPRAQIDVVVCANRERRNEILLEVLVLVVPPDDHHIGLELVQS